MPNPNRNESISELAADKLQTMIIDAVCSSDDEISRYAQDWLHLFSRPTETEITHPKGGSFIAICKILRLNWSELIESVKGAVALTVPEPIVLQPYLTLVHSNELGYTRKNETLPNSYNPSGAPKGERQLHLQIVPTTRRSSKPY